jgi:hypothetical protein
MHLKNLRLEHFFFLHLNLQVTEAVNEQIMHSLKPQVLSLVGLIYGQIADWQNIESLNVQ